MTRTFSHILVPYNGTDGSYKAFRKAIALATDIRAKVTIITCLEKRPTFALFKYRTKSDEFVKEQKAIERQHNDLKSFAKEHNIECNSKIVRGELASAEILGFVKQNDVDLIIMSKTKFSSHYEKFHYHSTLENVFRNALCSLLVLN